MKWLRLCLVFVLLVGPVAPQRADQLSTPQSHSPQSPDQRQASAKPPSIDVHFSPDGGCTEAVVKEMNAAKDSILVQAYSFTSAPIAKALVEAHKRGVRIEVILDKSNRTKNYSAADFVQHAGIPTLIDGKHTIAHNKIMILDGEVVITGSFNFTRAAEENNAETVNSVLPGPTRSEGVEQFVEGLAKVQGTDAASVETEFFRSMRLSGWQFATLIFYEFGRCHAALFADRALA
jgi:phosphatidylserine/phosphatidylglycerophosphate/cardiolipin synthase-like enzyme